MPGQTFTVLNISSPLVRASLFHGIVNKKCSYVLAIDKANACTRDLRDYLSLLGTHGCEVIVLDASSREMFDENRRLLRWVSRHVAARAPFYLVRCAANLAFEFLCVLARE